MRLHTCLASLWLFGSVLAQDWARYRGPGDLLPPQLGGATKGMADLTVWEFAWEFQREALQPPLAAGAALAPAVLAPAVAALRAGALDPDEALATMSLWALARLGREHDEAGAALRQLVGETLLQRPAPIREVAVLGLGLAARSGQEAIANLRDLASDTAAGRKLAGVPEVPERLRCFALYGLGLAAAGDRNPELQFRVLAAIERMLLPGVGTPPQVRIAALHALVLLQLDAAPALSAPALVLLDHQWSLEEPAQHLSVRAQVPLAAAAMLRPADADAAVWRERLVEALQKPTANAVTRSCAQALGRLCRPADEEAGEVLRSAALSAKDQQTRNLAFLALGLIGGPAHEAWLLQQLGANGTSFLYRPWIAFGLGAGTAMRAEPASAELLAGLVAGARSPNPAVFGAFAVSLGLVGARSSAADLAGLLRRHAAKGDMASSLAAALGGCGGSDDLPLLEQVSGGIAAPRLLATAMAAMAGIGEPGITSLRGVLLDDKAPIERRGAAALALRGRACAPSQAALVGILIDGKQSAAARQFAAMAIGSLNDRSPRHWSARLAAGIDYRSATPVLVHSPYGVLRLP